MNANRLRWCLVALLAAGPGGCGGATPDAHRHEGEESAHHDEGPHGPHGGRLFSAADVRLELLIAEADGPPAFKAYLSAPDGTPIRPTTEGLTAFLERFAGRRDTIPFRIDGDHFHGLRTVEEPHSFRATLFLARGGTRHTWTFEQVESRVELGAEAIQAAGIVVGQSGPQPIEVTVDVPGEVRLTAERVVQVRPRFAGVVREMRKRLGEPVRRNEVLSLVHSNESLSEYPITAAMPGTVVSQDAAVGQAVDPQSVLYTVADLSTVWVDFPIYPQSAGRILRGQTVHVQSESGPPLSGLGTIRYVGPLLEQDTRVSYGRIVLDNRDRRWQPGLYVNARVVLEKVDVPVAVPEDAIVRMSFGPAVFRAEGNRFEMQPVATGRTDGRTTEITRGLEPGARVVVKNAFLLKAELGKSEAHHAH